MASNSDWEVVLPADKTVKLPNPKSAQSPSDWEVLEQKGQIPPSNPATNPEGFMRFAAKVAPELLPIAGGFIGGIPGAGLGSVASTELRNEFPDAFGKPPDSLTGLLTKTALETAGGAGLPNIKALGPITKAVTAEMKAAGIPHWGELVPWGVASEVSGFGWHNGVKAGLLAKYGPAAYRGLKQGVQDYRQPISVQDPELLLNQRSRTGPEFQAAKDAVQSSDNSIPQSPPVNPISTVTTISGRVPGSYSKAQALQQTLEDIKNIKQRISAWKDFQPTQTESPQANPTQTVSTMSGRIPGNLEHGEALSQQLEQIAKDKAPARDPVTGKFLRKKPKSVELEDQD